MAITAGEKTGDSGFFVAWIALPAGELRFLRHDRGIQWRMPTLLVPRGTNTLGRPWATHSPTRRSYSALLAFVPYFAKIMVLSADCDHGLTARSVLAVLRQSLC